MEARKLIFWVEAFRFLFRSLSYELCTVTPMLCFWSKLKF